jgi:predicted nucleic acid-binding protein
LSRIYWDTILFVYLIEDNHDFADTVQAIHQRIELRGDEICTSVFTVGEVLTGPRKKGREDLVAEIRRIFRSPRYEIQPFTIETADIYAQIRASNNVKPADAIHLATAAHCRANLFLTNDARLSKLVIPGIDFIAGLDVNLF